MSTADTMMHQLRKAKHLLLTEGWRSTASRLVDYSRNKIVTAPRRARVRCAIKIFLPEMRQRVATAYREEPEEYLAALQQRTLSYVSANHLPVVNAGAYSFRIGGTPLLYASCYAALTRDLYNHLGLLTHDERQAWVDYINSYQCEDGLFRDPAIACPDADRLDWWGWRHLSLHALMALCALGGVAARPLRLLDRFRRSGEMSLWLATRNWRFDACNVSNEIQNTGTMLQYARDYQGALWCDQVLDEMYAWLDSHQEPSTGYWGYPMNSRRDISMGIQTGYHLWCLYFYDNRTVPYPEKIIDRCLELQNETGGFGVQANSSACEDIDAIDPLVRFIVRFDYRRHEVAAALEHAFLWVLCNHNETDGGWVFKRYEPYDFVPHRAMWTGVDESHMFATWFRTLSLAYIAKACPQSPVAGMGWNLPKFPGHQFWLP